MVITRNAEASSRATAISLGRSRRERATVSMARIRKGLEPNRATIRRKSPLALEPWSSPLVCDAPGANPGGFHARQSWRSVAWIRFLFTACDARLGERCHAIVMDSGNFPG